MNEAEKNTSKVHKKSKEIIKEGKNEVIKTFNIIKNRKFEGHSGIAIKNGIYQFTTTFISKVGAFLFTVILARIMMPELFGLYNLALSTILLFVTISELGIGQTFLRFVCRSLGENKHETAKAYAMYLTKIKLIVISVTSLALVISAKFISQNYYQKPIFLALLFGSLYIVFAGLAGFSYLFFQATNNFKILLGSETLLQVVRTISVPILVLYAISSFASKDVTVLVPIIALALLWNLVIIFLFIFGRKKLDFLNSPYKELQSQEKTRVKLFILSACALGLTGLFFGFIDTVILGKFVSSEYIGYYKAASGLVGAIMPLLIFSNVLLPIFSRISQKSLESGLKKSTTITLFLSTLLFLVLFAAPNMLIRLIYGESYITAALLLRILSLLVISMPLTSIYVSYFIAQGHPEKVTKILIFSTIVSIILNYLLISIGSTYSDFSASIGAAIATVVTTFIYLFALLLGKRSFEKQLSID